MNDLRTIDWCGRFEVCDRVSESRVSSLSAVGSMYSTVWALRSCRRGRLSGGSNSSSASERPLPYHNYYWLRYGILCTILILAMVRYYACYLHYEKW